MGTRVLLQPAGTAVTVTSPTPGAPTSAVQAALGRIIATDPAYGCVADGQTVTDGGMASGTAVLNSASGLFKSTDRGKLVTVVNATVGNAVIVGTITGFTSATQVTVSVTAAANYSGATVWWGTDNAAAFARFRTALTAGAAGGQLNTGYLPPGNYCSSANSTAPSVKKFALEIPFNANLIADTNARVVAMAAMDSVLSTDQATKSSLTTLDGGIWDSNQLANYNVAPGFYGGITLKNMGGDKGVQGALHTDYNTLGSGGLTCLDSTFQISRTYLNAGSIGLNVTVGDSIFRNVVPMGYETGVSNSGGNNEFFNVHPWARQSVGTMKYGFVDTGLGTYENCYSDTPSIYCWWLKGSGNSTLTNCLAFNNNQYGLDNVVIAVRLESGASVNSDNLQVKGSSGARIAVDFQFGGSASSSKILGTVLNSFVVAGASNQQINGTTVVNGPIRHFLSNQQDYGSSNFTQSARHVFATGNVFTNGADGGMVGPGANTTANRPSTAQRAGAMFFDTTLGKPIWRNAANTGWVDATGATV